MVTSSSNSPRCCFEWVEWSLAWSSVAVSLAVAEACFRMLRVLVDAWMEGEWKRVIGSRVLLCLGVRWWVGS